MKLRRIAVAVAGAALTVVSLAAPVGASQQSLGGGASTSIIGGSTVTTKSTAPWVVALRLNGSFTCTGTLIAAQYVLTARHCIITATTSYSVRVGSLYAGSGGVVLGAASITKHSSADLAIIKLNGSIPSTFTPYAKLPPTAPSSTGRVYGWGNTCEGTGSCTSEQLKVAQVRVSPGCVDTTRGRAWCVTGVDGRPSFGDSGGPLVMNSTVYGVCSSGTGASSNYTNVADSTYREWIRSVAGV